MRNLTFLSLAALLTVASPVVAGGGDHGKQTDKAAKAKHERCTSNAEDCLTATAAKYAKHGWLGLHTEKNEHGAYVVAEVAPDSPAAAAGFRRGDVLVAINGVALTAENRDQVKAVKSGLSVGSEVSYTVKRSDGKATLAATLSQVPRPVLAQWVGEHMLDHHVTAVVAQAN